MGPLFSLGLWFPGHGLTTHVCLGLFCVSTVGALRGSRSRRPSLGSSGVGSHPVAVESAWEVLSLPGP